MFRRINVLLALLLIFTALFTSAQAAPNSGVVGDGTSDSCSDAAFDAALSGADNITFNCGGPKTILVVNVKNITQNTVIEGGDVITLTGELATSLFHVEAAASLALSNIRLDGAYNSNGSGGAIWSAGPLTLTHVTIQHSKTSVPYCGGAVLAAGNAQITNSTFDSNVAGSGGAICVRSQPGTKVHITNSSFYSNQALDTTNGFGGALYVEYGTAAVLDSAFVFNNARYGGAATVLNDNATLTLEGSPSDTIFASKLSLYRNSAAKDGGALYNKSGVMSINHALLMANHTTTQTLGQGGAIFSKGVLTLTNSILTQNEGLEGGGVYVGNGSAFIDYTSFLNNISSDLGGGLYTENASTAITISNSAFSRNTAVSSGGGLASLDAALRIFNSSFTQNTAISGGGLLLYALSPITISPYVRLQNVTVSGNSTTSNQGGGVYNTGRVELYSMTIVSNTNGVWSGASAITHFRDTVLQNPGSLNCDGDGSASISDDTKNFSSDNSCMLPSSQTGSGLDPKLGPLTVDAFGPTAFHMPLEGSPLINQGSHCLEYDQRNASRTDQCDIGAVEYRGQLPRLYVPLLLK